MALNLTERFNISSVLKLVLVVGLMFSPPWVEADSSKKSDLDWVFQTGCFAPGSARNDWGTTCPCLLPPMAVKSKPPALRVVVDSEIQKQDAIIISQNESEKSSDSEKKDRSSENKDPETESQASEKKPVKDFKPSEKIGAEQAIAIPYDI